MGTAPIVEMARPYDISVPDYKAPRWLVSPRSRIGKPSKISNLMITELSYSHIPNICRGSLYTRSFRYVHLSVFRYRSVIKIALKVRKVSGDFEKHALAPMRYGALRFGAL